MSELAHDKHKSSCHASQNCCGTTFRPQVDIHETNDGWILSADMPGVEPDGLDVQFENGELSIHGKVAARHDHTKSLASEFGVGDFERLFKLGPEIDAEQISAELKNGVLTLLLPKSDAIKPRRIKVNSA